MVNVVVRDETPRCAAQVGGLSRERLADEYQPDYALTVQYLQPVGRNAVSLSLHESRYVRVPLFHDDFRVRVIR